MFALILPILVVFAQVGTMDPVHSHEHHSVTTTTRVIREVVQPTTTRVIREVVEPVTTTQTVHVQRVVEQPKVEYVTTGNVEFHYQQQEPSVVRIEQRNIHEQHENLVQICPTKVTRTLITGTNLYADTWYAINLKAGGIMSWAVYKVSETFNHAQVCFGEASAHFQKGGEFWNDSQWKLVQSEVPGYVTFVNRSQPNAVFTWAGKSPNGKYVVLYLDNATNKDYLPGGQYRDDCLWRVEQSGLGYYVFYNKRFPNNGIVTKTDEGKHPGRKFLQLHDGAPNTASSHDPNFQWSFTEVTDDGKHCIPGTSLYADEWYAINLKSKNAILSWSEHVVNKTGNKTQIVFGSSAPEFTKGGSFWQDSQWKLVQSEAAGYFTFVNRAQPNAVLTWAGKSASGKYVVLYLNQHTNADYLAGGKFRDDCLWRIEQEQGSTGFYNLYNKRFPQNGIVTWTNEGINEGKKFVQLYDAGVTESQFKTNGDYLWSFSKVLD